MQFAVIDVQLPVITDKTRYLSLQRFLPPVRIQYSSDGEEVVSPRFYRLQAVQCALNSWSSFEQIFPAESTGRQ
jgi:hypothetical protein